MRLFVTEQKQSLIAESNKLETQISKDHKFLLGSEAEQDNERKEHIRYVK